jgi:hypothetical protein
MTLRAAENRRVKNIENMNKNVDKDGYGCG